MRGSKGIQNMVAIPPSETPHIPTRSASIRGSSKIPEHFPFVKLGEFQVMPNHVHGIVIIDKQDTVTTKPRPNEIVESKNKFGPQSQNLASIIRGFKVGVTIEARKIDDGFGWQSRFHDHIIRDERSFYNISEYIQNNPHNWNSDDFNPR